MLVGLELTSSIKSRIYMIAIEFEAVILLKRREYIDINLVQTRKLKIKEFEFTTRKFPYICNARSKYTKA